MGGACTTLEGDGKCIQHFDESLKARENPEDLGVNGRIVLRWICWKACGRLWIGFMWLTIGTGGGLR
jgi:hypothetical protein